MSNGNPEPSSVIRKAASNVGSAFGSPLGTMIAQLGAVGVMCWILWQTISNEHEDSRQQRQEMRQDFKEERERTREWKQRLNKSLHSLIEEIRDLRKVLGGEEFLCSAPSEPKDKPPAILKKSDLSGYYTFQGKQSGKTYHGIVMLRKVKDIYLVVWSLEGGTFTGVGVIKQDYFIVGWAADGRPMRGLGVYKIGDKAMDGELVALPGGEPYRESWRFLTAIPAPKEEE